MAQHSRYRMPAEWEPHERCLIAWPLESQSYAGEMLDAARREYAAVARAVAAHEPVLVVAAPGLGRDARDLCGGDVEVIELPLDEPWIRDMGPTCVHADDGSVVGVDFDFNSWGEVSDWARDDRIPRLVLEHLGLPRRHVAMVVEGGQIAVDGRGTLITTEQSMLHPNRNPQMTRGQIEGTLADALGATHVIWLPYGLHADDVTDGHVDAVCAFAGPGVVLAQTVVDPLAPERTRLELNLEALAGARAADGEPLRVIEMPYLAELEVGGTAATLSYLNFLVANGVVVVPVAGDEQDEPALELIADAFPGREVVGVPGRTLAYGGGGVHCITKQIPAAAGATA